MRREADFFGEVELNLIYIAKKLREALKIETLLTTAGIDYFVEPDTYTGGLLFRRELTGAFFYVLPTDVERTQQSLLSGDYQPYQIG
jgi:hypothetical protein